MKRNIRGHALLTGQNVRKRETPNSFTNKWPLSYGLACFSAAFIRVLQEVHYNIITWGSSRLCLKQPKCSRFTVTQLCISFRKMLSSKSFLPMIGKTSPFWLKWTSILDFRLNQTMAEIMSFFPCDVCQLRRSLKPAAWWIRVCSWLSAIRHSALHRKGAAVTALSRYGPPS